MNILPDSNLLDDGHDEHSFHFILLDRNTVIAAARLCKHELLTELPDSHLYLQWKNPLLGSYGCCSRLVVHPDCRQLGIAAMLDKARADAAVILGCNALAVIWNEHSGVRRRDAIEAQGFVSASDGKAIADGEWGCSYPFARRIDINHKEILQIFSDDLNNRVRFLKMPLANQAGL
ncbi:MAG: GNAT family N-acetyltransferase [Nitrosomonadales bacterium]|nr:GNAT family N-acetyltransferase [Nitrosomonadales bacterium]